MFATKMRTSPTWRGTPLVPAFTDTVTGSTDGQTPHISQRACGFSFRSTQAPKRPGARLPQCGIRAVREQDIALPLYMKRIHHLSLHRMNYVQSVPGKQSRVKSEGKREKLAKILCGIKDSSLLELKRFFVALWFLKRLIIIFGSSEAAFTIITDARCAAKLCSNPLNFIWILEKISKFSKILNLSGCIWGKCV